MDMDHVLRRARRGFTVVHRLWGSKTKVKICFQGVLADRISVEIKICCSALDPVCCMHLYTVYTWTHPTHLFSVGSLFPFDACSPTCTQAKLWAMLKHSLALPRPTFLHLGSGGTGVIVLQTHLPVVIPKPAFGSWKLWAQSMVELGVSSVDGKYSGEGIQCLSHYRVFSFEDQLPLGIMKRKTQSIRTEWQSTFLCSIHFHPLRNGWIQWSWRSLLPKWFRKSMILWNTGKYWMCLRLFFWRNSRVRSISCGSYHKIFLCTTKDQESSRCNKSPTFHNYTDVNNGHVEASPFTFCKAFSLVSISISHQIKHWTGEDTRLP